VRLASILFALLAALVTFFNVAEWLQGVPLRGNTLQISIIAIYFALSGLLWRQVPFSRIAGLIIAAIGLLVFSGAAYFVLPLISSQLGRPSGLVPFTASTIVPILLNLGIVLALTRVLLSNQRLERP
jgi:hypothetical protein